MIGDILSDKITTALAKALEGYAARHKAIAANIANAETPGYKRVKVSFEEDLRQALTDSDKERAVKSMQNISPKLVQDFASPARPDGNNVSLDKEMTELIENGLSYQTVAAIIQQKIAGLRSVINEGRR